MVNGGGGGGGKAIELWQWLSVKKKSDLRTRKSVND